MQAVRQVAYVRNEDTHREESGRLSDRKWKPNTNCDSRIEDEDHEGSLRNVSSASCRH